ncbi:MAG TPA: universal stress protein [Solirubrobacteraceae bacterium]|jgi:nucleotide-binding universal stress UspA family protein|nr:universal stress protein [Solirubrobacteraceae bacterium]
MFKNVLVGVDGRPNGRDAIALAARLTDPAGSLTLAHVHSGELRPSHALAPSVLRGEREASEALLEQERDAAGVDAELLSVVAMGAGRGLHEQADEREADLLVVGSCSHGAFGRAMLGDDARAALNGAPCAVAIAARGYAAQPAPLATLGVAYNGSQESKAALATARALARRGGASVHALEVVSLPAFAYTGLVPPAIGESIDVLLQQANGRLQALPDVEGRAVYGVTGEELARFGDEVELLIVGSRGYGPLRRLVLGSTSDYLQRHARCSLLVLARAAERDDELAAGGERRAASGLASPV